MDRLEKRIDEKCDSKLGLVKVRLSTLEKIAATAREVAPFRCLIMVDLQARAAFLVVKRNLEIKGPTSLGYQLCCDRECVLISLVALLGAMRVRNTKIICNLETPSFSSCKQINGDNECFLMKK